MRADVFFHARTVTQTPQTVAFPQRYDIILTKSPFYFNKELFFMKGYAVTAAGQHGWIEREKPAAGPLDAIVRPIALAPCSSDTHFMLSLIHI